MPSHPNEGKRVLGLFAKKPIPGQAKTRLAATTTPAWAVQVAEAALRDTVGRLAGIDAERVLGYTPVGAEPYFADLVHEQFVLQPQSAGDLGHRMAAFLAAQFQQGAGKAVLLGTDSPTLPVEFIEEAFCRLEHADVVLGPATDGGYYLVGCAGKVPPIFEGMTWGGSSVLADTVRRLADAAWRLALLPPWYDLDTLEDWQMLVGHVKAMRRAGFDPGVPHLEKLIAAGTPEASG